MVRTLATERVELTAAQAEIERLRLIVQKLQRSQFGRRAERLDDDQLQLGFEDLNADIARVEATLPSARGETRRSGLRPDRPSLPAHLPREDIRLDLDHQVCPCCGGVLHAIGETVSEMLDHVPARLRVIRICRPRYGCRGCGTIHQAPAPERPIAKGARHSRPARPCPGRQILRSLAAIPAEPDLRPARRRDRPLDPGELGGRRLLVAGAATGQACRAGLRLAQAVRRRYADPGARSRARPHQDRPALGLRPR